MSWLPLDLSLGEGDGTPLQYSCLENPMDRGAWKAAVHGVTKSRTWLSDFTFTFHFSLSCIGEGNGNPFHCSCLENFRDGGAWWAAVYGIAQSQTRLKRLSSSSSSSRPAPQYTLIETHYLGHLMQKADSLEKTLMLGRLKARGEGGNRG